MRRSIHILMAAALGISGLATAQNAVQNGDFDTDVSGWTLTGANMVFDGSFNIVGSAGSGAIRVTNLIGDGTFQATQCVTGPFPPGNYNFGAWILMPDSQAGSGSGRVGAMFFTDSACSVVMAGTGSFVNLLTPSDEWDLITAQKTAPAQAGSVLIGLQTASQPNNGNPLTVYFDGVRFGPVPTFPVELQSFDVE